LAQGKGLGMRLAGTPVIPLAEHACTSRHNRTDERIRRRRPSPQRRESESAAHVFFVMFVGVGHVAIVTQPPASSRQLPAAASYQPMTRP